MIPITYFYFFKRCPNIKKKCINSNKVNSYSTFLQKMPKDEKYTSAIDMQSVTKSPLLQQKPMQAVVSTYAGRFLCDYVYCTSMATNESCGRALANAFVHVPPLDKPFGARELGEQLQTVIKAMLAQLKQKDLVDF